MRVTNALTNAPVGAAAITWTSGRGRVQATASGNGEALLEGVGTAGGVLGITAPRYQPGEIKLAEPPAMLYEVALMPVPAPVTTVEARVVNTSGKPVPDTVAELFPDNPFDIPQVAVTDVKGLVTFPDAPPGTLRLTATADGFAPAKLRITDDKRTGIVLRLSPGAPLLASASVTACLRDRQVPRRCEQVAQPVVIESR